MIIDSNEKFAFHPKLSVAEPRDLQTNAILLYPYSCDIPEGTCESAPTNTNSMFNDNDVAPLIIEEIRGSGKKYLTY